MLQNIILSFNKYLFILYHFWYNTIIISLAKICFLFSITLLIDVVADNIFRAWCCSQVRKSAFNEVKTIEKCWKIRDHICIKSITSSPFLCKNRNHLSQFTSFIHLHKFVDTYSNFTVWFCSHLLSTSFNNNLIFADWILFSHTAYTELYPIN